MTCYLRLHEIAVAVHEDVAGSDWARAHDRWLRADGVAGRDAAFGAMAVTLIELDDLATADLTPYAGVVFSGRSDQDLLARRRDDVTAFLQRGGVVVYSGQLTGDWLPTQMIVIASVIWAGTARELRSQVLSLREHDHIQALRAMGARAGYVLPRHVLPSVAPLVVPQFVLATKTAIPLEASLAFLGLGDITAKSWGTMLSLAQSRSAFLTDAWLWWVLPPGVLIAVTVLSFALLGYAFEEWARPSLRDVGSSSRTTYRG